MLDIKFIRENLDIVKMAAKKKHIDVDLDRLVAVDDTRREIMARIEERKAEQNRVSKEIAAHGIDQTMRQQMITEMKAVKAEVEKDEEALRPVIEEWQALMLQVPNVPDMSVPDGESDADNV